MMKGKTMDSPGSASNNPQVANPEEVMTAFFEKLNEAFSTGNLENGLTPEIVSRFPDLPRFTIEDVFSMCLRIENSIFKKGADPRALFGLIAFGLLGPLANKTVVDVYTTTVLLNGGTAEHARKVREVFSRPALLPDQIAFVHRFFNEKRSAAGPFHH